jgi:NapC/NirT cytochrome c family, N-terminal region
MSHSGPSDHPTSLLERLQLLLSPIFYLSRNTLSLVGVVLATSLFFTMLVFYIGSSMGAGTNPYVGIIMFLVFPGIFVFGLLLIPAGMLLKHRRESRQGTLPGQYPRLDFNHPDLRRLFSFIVLATAINGIVVINASYRGVEYMDSVTFCGQACHSVMAPEYTAYQNSPHARVSCVQCHIGPGASWVVRSKLAGLRQILAVSRNTFSRPIPTPIDDLRPARETCEQCHWPSKFTGSLLSVRPKFAEDEKNTASKTVLLLKVGGGTARGRGIHSAHLDLAREITYLATDAQRQEIPWVRYVSAGGESREYAAPDWDKDFSKGELRVMDCMDCHNRPTHTFQLPEQALDDALASGRLDASLPFLKKKAVELLKQPYPSQDAAAAGISRALADYYRETYPEVWNRQRESVDLAAGVLREIYRDNVFPEMKVDWGSYPNNLGHMNFPGCFRCHDDNHLNAQGTALTQDCGTCHSLLAVEEENPAILEQLTRLAPEEIRGFVLRAESAARGNRKKQILRSALDP